MRAVSANNRFLDNGDGTVTDTEKGLMWSKTDSMNDLKKSLRNRPVREPSVANREIQDGLLRLYKERPELAILFELMTDFDEGMQEWRYRHVKLVERTIGKKHGTGGSPGVAFLKESLFLPIFPDLWAIRHKM